MNLGPGYEEIRHTKSLRKSVLTYERTCESITRFTIICP